MKKKVVHTKASQQNDAEYERLSKLNVPFPCGAPMTFDFGIRNFYVADPEGNLLEIGSMNEIPVS